MSVKQNGELKETRHPNGGQNLRLEPKRTSGDGAILVTGGAGFIGSNLSHRLASEGRRVIIYDNLSREGVQENLEWLTATHGSLIEVEQADTRNYAALQKAVRWSKHVIHLAAQVAVTTSLIEPIEDFEINARGTLNVLEAIRAQSSPPSLI